MEPGVSFRLSSVKLKLCVLSSFGDQGDFESADLSLKLCDLRVPARQHVHSDGHGLVAMPQIDK